MSYPLGQGTLIDMKTAYDTWKTSDTSLDAPECPECEDGYLYFYRTKGYPCWECWECGWEPEDS